MLRRIIVLLGLMLSVACDAAVLTPGEAINVAGRQRMLSQRIVKTYVQIALELNPDKSRRELEAAVALYDDQLKSLQAYVATDAPVRTRLGTKSIDKDLERLATKDAQRTTLVEMTQRWEKVRTLVQAPMERRNALIINGEAEELLRLAHTLVGQIEESSGLMVGRVINLAGRQRMLSQRLAKLYMLRAMGEVSAQIRNDMDSAQLEFSAGLTALKEASHSGPEIQRELDAATVSWQWFKQALELDGAVSYRLVVADASDSVLASMENIVAMYEALPQK